MSTKDAILELQKRAAKELTDIDNDLHDVDDIEVTVSETEEAFGFAYADPGARADAYKPWASRTALDVLVQQLRAHAARLTARADAIARFSEELQRSAEMDDTPTEPGIAVAVLPAETSPASKPARTRMPVGGAIVYDTPDDVFLDYVEAHAQTERALFHKRDVIRLHDLAGKPLLVDNCAVDDWSALHTPYTAPLVKSARARLKKKQK